MRLLGISILLALQLFPAGHCPSQERSLFAAVYTNRLFIVGAGNPQTGLFRRDAADTTWAHLGAPNIRAFGFDAFRASRGRILYVGAGNGVHKSTDGGRSWKIVTGWRITEVLSVAADQQDSNAVYISSPYGVWKTTDGGGEWFPASHGLESMFVSRVIIDPDDHQRLFCSTESGVYASTNAGRSWIRAPLSPGGIRTILRHPRVPGFLAAGTEDRGVYLSTDGGVSWRRPEGEMAGQTIYALLFHPTDGRIVYAAGFETGVFRTTDAGATWQRFDRGLDETSIHALVLDPERPERILAATLGRGVYVSDDGGESWSAFGLDGTKIWTLDFLP